MLQEFLKNHKDVLKEFKKNIAADAPEAKPKASKSEEKVEKKNIEKRKVSDSDSSDDSEAVTKKPQLGKKRKLSQVSNASSVVPPKKK